MRPTHSLPDVLKPFGIKRFPLEVVGSVIPDEDPKIIQWIFTDTREGLLIFSTFKTLFFWMYTEGSGGLNILEERIFFFFSLTTPARTTESGH